MTQGRPRGTGPGLIAIASSIIPGLGHLLGRRRRVGFILIVVDLLAVLAVVAVWTASPTTLIRQWVTPSSLTVLAVANVAAFAYRAAATIDSFSRSPGRSPSDWIGGAIAGVVIILPHVWIGGLVATEHDLITSVFAAPTTTTASTIETATTTVATTRPQSSVTTTVPPTTTTTEPPRLWDGYERFNIVLLGSDAGVGRTGTRTDTIVLVSIDPTDGDVAMISIPRNLTEAPLPDGMGIWGCNCFPDIITHLWANAEWYPDAFPGPQTPPVNALKASLGLIFDIDIQYYAKVDLAGFVGIVDAFGGVTIDVPKRLVDEAYPHELGGTEYVVFEEGVQHLDGHRTLAYSRIRRHSGDFARMHRQRCVLGALAEQASPLDLLAGYSDFADAVKANVETDIPIDGLADLIDLLGRVSTDRLGTLRVTRYNYGAGGNAGYQLYDLERIRQDAHRLMDDPTIHLETQDSYGFDLTCDLSFD